MDTPDLQSRDKSQEWFYSEEVKRHFFNPVKFMKDEEDPASPNATQGAKKFEFDGVGQVGSPVCGDMMKLWIRVEPVRSRPANPVRGIKIIASNGAECAATTATGRSASNGFDKKTQKIVDCRWRTYGCGSAIASTSALAEMITENGGMDIEDALKIKPQDIMARLGGLPEIKIHCSVLGDQALEAAIKDYKDKLNKQL